MLGVNSPIDLYSNKNIVVPHKYQFMKVCLTILYSEDELEVKRAYDKLFTVYRQMIICGGKLVQLSCFEEVVYKILNDKLNQEEDEFYHGEKYPAFVKLMVLVKEQAQFNFRYKVANRVYKNVVYRDLDEHSEVFPLADLSKIIMNFIYNQTSKKEKNDTLMFFFNKYISVLKVEK